MVSAFVLAVLQLADLGFPALRGVTFAAASASSVLFLHPFRALHRPAHSWRTHKSLYAALPPMPTTKHSSRRISYPPPASSESETDDFKQGDPDATAHPTSPLDSLRRGNTIMGLAGGGALCLGCEFEIVANHLGDVNGFLSQPTCSCPST